MARLLAAAEYHPPGITFPTTPEKEAKRCNSNQDLLLRCGWTCEEGKEQFTKGSLVIPFSDLARYSQSSLANKMKQMEAGQ